MADEIVDEKTGEVLTQEQPPENPTRIAAIGIYPTAIEPPPMAALVAKVVAAARDMKHLEKSGRNKFQNYSYISVEDLISEVRGPLLRRGVLLLRPVCKIRSYETKQATDESSNRVKTATFVTLDIEYCLTDGFAEIRLQATSEARDSGDKALQKAETSALKYTLFQNFLLQGNEDDLDEGQPDLQVDGSAQGAEGGGSGQAAGGTDGPGHGSGKSGGSRRAPRGRRGGGEKAAGISHAMLEQVTNAYSELATLTDDDERVGKFAAIIGKQYDIGVSEIDGWPNFDKMSEKQAATVLNILQSKIQLVKKERGDNG